jgi:AcrR family transcriptional regulator
MNDSVVMPTIGPTAERLLQAARQLFATYGYEGTSIRAITSEADANLGAVTYHYGSKEALYSAVVESVLEPLRRRILAASSGPGDAVERLEAIVRAFFEQLRENPDQAQFMLQQVAAGTEPIVPVRLTLHTVMGLLAEVLEEGQREGLLRPIEDPVLTGISVVAQPVQLTLVGRLLGGPTGPLEGVSDQVMEEHAVRFIRTALTQSPEEDR